MCFITYDVAFKSFGHLQVRFFMKRAFCSMNPVYSAAKDCDRDINISGNS